MTQPKNYAPLVEAANAAAASTLTEESVTAVEVPLPSRHEAWDAAAKARAEAAPPLHGVDVPVPELGETFRGTEDELREFSRVAETRKAKLLADAVAGKYDADFGDEPPHEPWRRTGRTTAMLAKAWERADKGDSVVVLVPDARMIDTFKGVMPPSARVHVVTPTMAYALQGQGFDAVFVDHSAWEDYPFETAEFLVAIRPRVRR